jgi:hypothetical protein
MSIIRHSTVVLGQYLELAQDEVAKVARSPL